MHRTRDATMTTAAKTVELAYQDRDGSWELIGDFGSEDEAIAAAKEWAAGDVVYRDDFGTAVFGINVDPSGGHYETRVEVYEDGTFTVQ
jgi:hypothetical protein